MSKKTLFSGAGILLVVLALVTIVISMETRLPDQQIGGNEIPQFKKVNKQARIRELQKYFDGIRIPFGAHRSPAPANYIMEELQKVRNANHEKGFTNKAIEWIERGPSNVGGRTRGLIVDPADPTYMTWYVGSATGGLWKTTDGGQNWTCLTPDIPYHATTTLAMAKSNNDVIYMGTGESFPGSVQTTGGGLFVSTDRGNSWDPFAFTVGNEDFRYVNRIEVDPDNENIVLAATNTGIFKSTDGGETWEMKYESETAVEDLVADTSNFNYMFAGVNSYGVIRSIDAGETWELASDGIGDKARIELAISPVNPQKVYASIETGAFDALYVSWDRGNNWQLVKNSVVDNYVLLSQGGYDNTIAAHPYDENIVFWGGVNLWKADIGTTIQDGEGAVTKFEKINTQSFLEFVNFTGNLYTGMNTGDQEEATNLEEGDFVSIEVRFGPGLTQKAHRFFVPEEATSGVPADSFAYQDYIDVPFEVWDVTNNRQLMCSFRDQERDGEFNLYERTGEGYGELGREYLFINSVEYDPANPDPNIAVKGGRSYKLIYFFWMVLPDGGTWDPPDLPDSKLYIEYSIIQERLSEISNVSDAYNDYGGENSYSQSAGINKTSIPGLHPDHHELIMIPINEGTGEFRILNSNDGGISLSLDGGDSFTQFPRNYVTTQFYGVSKKPYRNEYIGGTQDNGTWQSPIDVDATTDTAFYFRLPGDGFETVWNHQDSNRILGSVYYNKIYRSVTHGRSWELADGGISDGPFITKLTPVPSNNNIVFAVGSDGVYKTGNFVTTDWRLTTVGEGWIQDGSSVTSSHNVKVSPANEQIVWAGSAMTSEYGLSMFVSTDQGTSFSPVNEPAEPVAAYMSGFAVHPTEENTAFALYSVYNEPKIFRTTDLGDTWEDITQVDGSGASANGFPNVGCLSLLVFPETPDTIWVGTEIGIMESVDNGETWHYLESELPSVAIWQLFAQDNQVVVATYGRGIWTYQYGPVLEPPQGPSAITDVIDDKDLFNLYPNPTNGMVNLKITEQTASENVILEVFNMNGRLVYSDRLENLNTDNLITFDLSEQSKGIYLIHLRTEKLSYSERILLQ